jgi:hypothetical protein
VEEQYVDISKITVRQIQKDVAREFIIKHHYTHKASSTRYALGIYYLDESEHLLFADKNEKLIGCMSYGHPVSNRTIDSIAPGLELDEVLELTRLVCLDGYGKNLESYVIAQSFEWIRKNDPKVKVLVSYADPEVSHTGGIYRATNWIYQGCGVSKVMPDFSIKLTEDGEWVHSRTVGARYGNKNVNSLAGAIGHTFWRKEETAKHRYIYFLCAKKEKKHLLKSLKLPILSYNDIKPYTQLIQKVNVGVDRTVESIEVIQGVDNGWSNKQKVMKNATEEEES